VERRAAPGVAGRHFALVTSVPWLSPAGVVHSPKALDILLKSLTAKKLEQ